MFVEISKYRLLTQQTSVVVQRLGYLAFTQETRVRFPATEEWFFPFFFFFFIIFIIIKYIYYIKSIIHLVY